MKVTMRNYQPSAGTSLYKKQDSISTENRKNNTAGETQTSLVQSLKEELEEQEQSFLNSMAGIEENENPLSSILEQAKESSNFKVSVSTPDVSVGELATLLTRAETKMDVVQVSSKVMRALANLKMALVLSEGTQKQKIQQLIRRMEKLTKKVTQKMRNLSQEEQLELQRKRAAKQQELERETEIRKEIRRKKNKRHREERNYASKEVEEDRKLAMQETMSAMAGSMNASSAASAMASPAASASGTAAYEAAMSIGAAADGMSVDTAADVASVDVAV